MSSPNYPYPPSNLPQTNPQPGLSPVAYPSSGNNGFNSQYPYPPAGYPGGMPAPQTGTDLSWLLNSVKRNRIWFIPFALFFILVGYIVLAVSQRESAAATCTGLLFLSLGQALLVAFILATTKRVGGFTYATAWVASGVITGGWVCVLINMVLGISQNGSYFPTTLLIFSVLFVLILIGGIITGSVLASKPSEPISPAPALLISLFLLLAATTTPVIHAVGMILLIAAAACAVIKPRPAYFVVLGVSGTLGLANFIIGLASPAAACFLGLNGDYHGISLYGTLFSNEGQLEKVGWIYWIIGGLTWVFSAVVLAACILAIYQTIAKKPVTDLTAAFRNQSQLNQYPGYYQPGQYPVYPYPPQSYYGEPVPPAGQSGQPQPYPQFPAPPTQSFMPPNSAPTSQPPLNH